MGVFKELLIGVDCKDYVLLIMVVKNLILVWVEEDFFIV